MSAHTPGPWSLDDEGNLCGNNRYLIDNHGMADEADARLIAAAPKLLAELREVLEWHRIEKIPLRQQELDSIRAVISEATGERT